MDFFEFVLVISLTVGLPIAIINSILKYKREALQAERGGQGLSVGELKALLADVVREANAPLLERIEELEVERTGLPPAAQHGLLADVDDVYEEEPEAERPPRRRVRG